MKQKLFENVGRNTFKLITENVNESNPNAKLVREGLRKVFGTGSKQLSYKKLQGVGFGYIKSVEEAKKTAIQEARELAKEYGYTDNEGTQTFVKTEEEQPHPEADMSNPEEAREVQIGKEILQALDNINASATSGSLMADIRRLAEELIQLHGQR